MVGSLALALVLGAGLAWGPVRSALGLEGPDAAPADLVVAVAPPMAPPGALPDSLPEAPADAAPAAAVDDDLENLDPELRRRFEAARDAAAAAGVVLELTSGWRSPEEQQALVDAALATYGSAEEAHRWVLPPETSEHVAGRAVDVGPSDAAAWLEANAAAYGLCRTYENEWWHFEAMPADGGCPAMRADSSWGW